MNKLQKKQRAEQITLRCPHCGETLTHPSHAKYVIPSYPDRKLRRSMFCIEWIPKGVHGHMIATSWLTAQQAANHIAEYKRFSQRYPTTSSFGDYNIRIRRSVPIPLP